MNKPPRKPRHFDRRAAAMQRIVTMLHEIVYRQTAGRIGGRLFNSPVLLLYTIGRRSGRLRATPLLYLADGERLILVASNGGTAANPAWWHNLQARPRALVQIGARQMFVRATEATPEEHSRLWPLLTRMYPPYETYQQRTPRPLPVVILQPEAAGAYTAGGDPLHKQHHLT